MPSDPDGKVVQTQLDGEEYARLRRVADDEDRTLKEVLRRAVAEYTGSHGKNDPEDPFFADPVPRTDSDSGTDDGESADGPDDDRTLTATETESYLYE